MGSSMKRDSRNNEGGKNSKSSSLLITQGGISHGAGPKTLIQFTNGLEIEEDAGLDVEERKRKRIGPPTKATMDISDSLPSLEQIKNMEQYKEAVFSEQDYTGSNNNDLATLVVQASRPL